MEKNMVVIYGYNYNCFPWRYNKDKSVYKTCGFVIKYNNDRYIVSTRQKLISCSDIIAYSFNKKKDEISRHILIKIHHCIETNIIIFQVTDEDSFEIKGFDIKNFTIPNKNNEYQIIKVDLNLESIINQFNIHYYDIKYIKPTLFKKTFVPRNYMYKYKVYGNHSEDNFSGSLIIESENIVGISSIIINNIHYVVPMKFIKKIIDDYIYNSNNKFIQSGLTYLPFNYIIKEDVAIVLKQTKVSTINGNKIIKANDIILSINKNKIIVKNNDAFIYDEELKDFIPIDIYIMWNHNQDNILRIKIKRGEKIISIGVNKTKSTSSLNLTKLWEDNYESVIPYYNLNGIIITWLTHELIDILISHNYIPSNYIIDSLFEGDIDKLKDTLIIIDCLDDGVRYKYDLPTIKKKCLKNGNLNCYVVKKIKNICAQSISKLEDIDNLKTTNCKIKLQINNSIHKVIYA
ncbi:hypothetical protein H012_gp469 [Acanthamoeba polyphaga moumouvirus]|uniref:Uncharacterized protein n=2 Tax=Moumouvirus TaxID=3080801 RepID=L7RCM2_9VIRU|nr:hypothetical protein H012_gp469 [Acanthamoeba polyphaga moumouvirus]AGC01991.1 hypothetical protein Moumou_00455 [Acanthamoeba polyphaga moumouvirus]